MAERRTAVIDMGSNSFRLVVFTASDDGWWKRTDEIYLAVRIGEGLDATGELGAKPMQRGLEAAEVFASFCKASAIPAEDIRAVATSAIRDATNQQVFLDRVRKHTGLEVRVLSREEEATFGYLAVVNSTTLTDGAVLDLGGGSLQLVEVLSRHPGHLDSWPLGAVRMTEHFLSGDDPPPKKARKALRAHVAEMLEQDAAWLPRSGRRIVGIGGTMRNLASAAQAEAGEPSNGVQGFAISRDQLNALIDRLASMKASERGSVKGIKYGRADLILAGALVVDAVLEHGGFDAIEVTEAGLREGIFFNSYLAGDPPLFDDVRRASVLNLAARYHVDPAHTEHVARLAMGLFDELADAGLHPGDRWERELLFSACILHDIGMSVDYDDHHKHSRYLILNAGLPGFEPREVALIAQAARYHRKGTPDFGELAPLAQDGDAERLDRMALLLRLAEDLERSRDQSVRAAHIAADDGTIHLELETDGAAAVERWAAQREVDLVDRAFGRQLKVEAA
ncbi:MAG: exopolyphosphatase / guanosine-5-triphosphate,3-diphosphate pyrophosphatase [Solirubrobacteraceae bacterium]|nr:exopolyphosphatase / guanosine-5-triphosphate,3-diphosphate pyrophosphatase [Solirubrobacteraceae bacterium]